MCCAGRPPKWLGPPFATAQGRDAEAAAGFVDEINLLNLLKGRQNIIQLVDSQVFTDEGLVYMVQVRCVCVLWLCVCVCGVCVCAVGVLDECVHVCVFVC